MIRIIESGAAVLGPYAGNEGNVWIIEKDAGSVTRVCRWDIPYFFEDQHRILGE